MKLCEGSPGHDCHLLFEQELEASLPCCAAAGNFCFSCLLPHQGPLGGCLRGSLSSPLRPAASSLPRRPGLRAVEASLARGRSRAKFYWKSRAGNKPGQSCSLWPGSTRSALQIKRAASSSGPPFRARSERARDAAAPPPIFAPRPEAPPPHPPPLSVPRKRRCPPSLPRACQEGGRSMAGTVLRVNGTTSLESSDKTVINVNFRQESSLSYLCQGLAALSRRRAPSKAQQPAEAAPTRLGRSGQQEVLGGAQILLGAVCIGLGVVFNLQETPTVPYYYFEQRNGAPFWMGSLFILSGTFSVVGERRGGKWVHLATCLNLASVVAGSVALAVGLAHIPSLTYQPYFIEELCKHRRQEPRYRSWEATTRPPYDERDQERAKQCQEALWALVCVFNGGRILLLVLSIAALSIALFCFGYGLRLLCCSCWDGWQEYMALGDPDASLAPEEPGKEENPA